jgi:hypothetical protein
MVSWKEIHGKTAESASSNHCSPRSTGIQKLQYHLKLERGATRRVGEQLQRHSPNAYNDPENSHRQSANQTNIQSPSRKQRQQTCPLLLRHGFQGTSYSGLHLPCHRRLSSSEIHRTHSLSPLPSVFHPTSASSHHDRLPSLILLRVHSPSRAAPISSASSPLRHSNMNWPAALAPRATAISPSPVSFTKRSLPRSLTRHIPPGAMIRSSTSWR